jgi:hypothetical protein
LKCRKRSTMPRKRPAVDDPRTREAREELIQGPSGVDLDVHDFSVWAAGLPLFRRKEDGNLSRALRLVVLAESVAEDATFSVCDGNALLDTASARIVEGRTILDLFVPEVYEPSTFSLRVEAWGREPFEAGVEVRPQRKWSVFLVHHSHLDIGYTDTQGSVLDGIGSGARHLGFNRRAQADVRTARTLADTLTEDGADRRDEIDEAALAPSRRGHDVTVMLQSLSSANEEVRVSFGLHRAARTWVGSHLEKHLEEARVDGETVRFAVPAGSLVSLVVDLEPGR